MLLVSAVLCRAPSAQPGPLPRGQPTSVPQRAAPPRRGIPLGAALFVRDGDLRNGCAIRRPFYPLDGSYHDVAGELLGGREWDVLALEGRKAREGEFDAPSRWQKRRCPCSTREVASPSSPITRLAMRLRSASPTKRRAAMAQGDIAACRARQLPRAKAALRRTGDRRGASCGEGSRSGVESPLGHRR